jgi:cytoskeletal protein CcmA (bactofilin family)
MKWVEQKIKAGSIQYVLVISVIILIVVSAFISLIYLQKRMAQKGELFKETIHHANLAFNYISTTNIPYDKETNIAFSEYDFEQTQIERTHWGVYDLIHVNATLKNETFRKIGIAGNKNTSRQALYLQDTNKPLVLVGNTKIKGNASLPKRGVKRGSIAGTSYYGASLIYGNAQLSSATLPSVSNSNFLKDLLKYKAFENVQEFQLEDHIKRRQSFNEPTLLYNSSETIYLQNISLQGNIVITSNTAIIVSSSAVLEHVILMAPEIKIQSKTVGSIQALATQKIEVGEFCKLEYPSALVVFQEEEQKKTTQKEPVIKVSKNTQVNGVLLYETNEKAFDYNVQVFIGESSTIIGEVYCEKNLELKGTVKGSVYTGNFIAKESGGVYINHIYNGVIDSNALTDEFSGLFINSANVSVAKWVY